VADGQMHRPRLQHNVSCSKNHTACHCQQTELQKSINHKVNDCLHTNTMSSIFFDNAETENVNHLSV